MREGTMSEAETAAAEQAAAERAAAERAAAERAAAERAAAERDAAEKAAAEHAAMERALHHVPTGGTYGPAFQRPSRWSPRWNADLEGGKGKAGRTHHIVSSCPSGRPPFQAVRATRPSGATGGKGAHIGSSSGMPFGPPPTRR